MTRKCKIEPKPIYRYLAKIANYSEDRFWIFFTYMTYISKRFWTEFPYAVLDRQSGKRLPDYRNGARSNFARSNHVFNFNGGTHSGLTLADPVLGIFLLLLGACMGWIRMTHEGVIGNVADNPFGSPAVVQ